jgi:DNA-directed RNA polymerase subunit F
MRGTVYKEIRTIKRSGGDLYQKFADKHSLTIDEAKDFLYPFLYGAGLSKTKPIITEGEAINLLDQFNKLYTNKIEQIKNTNLNGEDILYIRHGEHLIKMSKRREG